MLKRGKKTKFVSLLKDVKFKNGFMCRGTGTPMYYKTRYAIDGADDSIEGFSSDKFQPYLTLNYNKGKRSVPAWSLAQWASRYPLDDIMNSAGAFNHRFTDLGKGKYIYENKSKLIATDTKTGDFRLSLKASECYVHGDRLDGQEWPHLLIEQMIGSPEKPLPEMSVKNMKSLKISLDMKVNSYKDCMREPANPNLHATVLMFYLFVSYIKPGEKEYSDMLWLGMTLFDNRKPFNEGMSMLDSGTKDSATGKYIFNIPSDKYLSTDNNVWVDGEMTFEKWASVDFDILPYIEQSLKEAKEAGAMKDVDMDNLYINGTYLGFENAGTYDIDMSFRNFDIKSEIIK